jgi:hypothetical protein
MAVLTVALSAGLLAACGQTKEEALEEIRTNPEKVEQEISAEISQDPGAFREDFIDALVSGTGGAISEEQAGCVADKAAGDPTLLTQLAELGLQGDAAAATPDNDAVVKLTQLLSACGATGG